MIVVIGGVRAEQRDGTILAAGVAARVALAAAAVGRRVELVSRVGDDPTGDAVLLALTQAGVGHVATLRDAAHSTDVVDADIDDALDGEGGVVPSPAIPALDANDVGLALRYLPEISVVVLVHPADGGVIAETANGASFASAALVVLVEPGQGGANAPESAVVLEVPPGADGVGEAVGRFAAAIDVGEAPAAAFEATIGVLAGDRGD